MILGKGRLTWECEGDVEFVIIAEPRRILFGTEPIDNNGDEITSLAPECLRPTFDQELGNLDTTP